jgi:hypothetical protein
MKFKDFHAKCEAIVAAAEGVLSGSQSKTLKTLLSVALKSKRKSAPLLTWGCAHTDIFPNAVLLIDPSIKELKFARKSDVLVYPEHELKKVISDNSRIANCFKEFQRISLIKGNAKEVREKL